MKTILVISGKGGTGKTTISSTLIDLMNVKAFADCDIDAPNLHLIQATNKVTEKKPFYGMDIAKIDESKCINCGKCFNACRFNAIHKNNGIYKINPNSCEGCFVCSLVCPSNAIERVKNNVGTTQVFKDDRVFSTAILSMGSGNSGKLVTEVKKNLYKNVSNQEIAIIDGSPGIGCPVIASLSGIDLALIVTEPTLSGISDLKRIVKTSRTFDTNVAIIINKYDLNKEMSSNIINYSRMENIPFLGTISYDKEVSKAINNNLSLALINCKVTNEIKIIMNKIYDLINK